MMSLDLDHVKCDNYLNCVKIKLILALEQMIDFRLASEKMINDATLDELAHLL